MTGQYWTPGPLGAMNPCSGCEHKSEACRNCYAEANHRVHHGAWVKYYREGGEKPSAEFYSRPFNEITLRPEQLAKFTKLAGTRKPHVVFIGNMTDLFHEKVPDEYILEVFRRIHSDKFRRNKGLVPHTFLILTKRTGRMRDFIMDQWAYLEREGRSFAREFPNLWLGTTVENQARADERLSVLKAMVDEGLISHGRTWGSFEPLLGHIQASWLPSVSICGGESGPGARPMHPDWARSLKDQCDAASVRFYFKQWGEYFSMRQFHDKINWINKASTWMDKGDMLIDMRGLECIQGSHMDAAQYPVAIETKTRSLINFDQQIIDDVDYAGMNPFTGEGY